jgi:hypothetical protein
MKSWSFEPYFDLPRRVAAELELCAGGRTVPRERLLTHGWSLENPALIAKDPWSYRTYIHGSCAEFSVAKHGYVVSNSGWFSERTACYLASGRPAIVQDTGISRFLPTGQGLHVFNDPDSAVGAIDRCLADPAAQGKAARQIAEDYFDSSLVLESLLERTLEGAPTR